MLGAGRAILDGWSKRIQLSGDFEQKEVREGNLKEVKNELWTIWSSHCQLFRPHGSVDHHLATADLEKEHSR